MKKPAKAKIISLFIAVVATWAAAPWVIFHFKPLHVSDFGSAGQFGDLFGAVNALFSGLAFAGFWVALWLQLRETSRSNRLAALSAKVAALPLLIEATRNRIAHLEKSAGFPEVNRMWANAESIDPHLEQLNRIITEENQPQRVRDHAKLIVSAATTLQRYFIDLETSYRELTIDAAP